jgi:hypothetical protein
MAHEAATSGAPSGASAAPNGRKAGGQLQAMFPNREVVWIDDELKGAIDLACSVEKERAAVLLRRWFCAAARAEGYLSPVRSVGA